MNSNTEQNGTTSTIDVAYFSGHGSKHNDWELRYSIRSIVTNFNRLGSIWLVGKCPDFIDPSTVIHIPFPDEPTQNKDRNLIQKLAYLSGEQQLTEEFIINSDDHFIMRPLEAIDFKPYIEDEFKVYRHDKLWHRRLLRTRGLMKDNGFTTHNYDTHIPHLVTKTHCRELLKWNFDGNGLCVFSLYFNLLNIPNPPRINDSIRFNARKNFTEITPSDFAIVNDKTAGKKEFKEHIKSLFPNKSPYEL
jgi:hypothetical protein